MILLFHTHTPWYIAQTTLDKDGMKRCVAFACIHHDSSRNERIMAYQVRNIKVSWASKDRRVCRAC